MKAHMKRIAAPATWDLARKEETFTLRPRPGGATLRLSLPLGNVLRLSKMAITLKEIKYLLSSGNIMVDGKTRKDHKFPVGLLAVVSAPATGKSYRLTLFQRGTLGLLEIGAEEAGTKVVKVSNIFIKNGQFVHSLSDGRVVTAKQKLASTGSSLLLKVPSQEVKEVLPLEKNAFVFLVSGKHPAQKGTVKELQEKTAVVHTDNGDFSVSCNSILVVGKTKSTITV